MTEICNLALCSVPTVPVGSLDCVSTAECLLNCFTDDALINSVGACLELVVCAGGEQDHFGLKENEY